jgi:CTP synthase
MASGIFPDIIVTRSDEPIEQGIKDKIALFCNVKKDCVIENKTVPVLYQAPIMLRDENLDEIVCRELKLKTKQPDLKEWKTMLSRIEKADKSVKIALVGKYIQLHDAYLSVMEALKHAGWENESQVTIKWVDSETVDPSTVQNLLGDVQGILVPGGFGDRGIEGKIEAARFARENNIPYLGICLGMQIAVIEFARHILNLEDANSREFNKKSKHTVIDLMPDQKGNIPKGGTMRLGAYPCAISEGTIMQKAYKEETIAERHRHRYEFNNEYRNEMMEAGLIISGTSPDGKLVEAVELKGHPFYLGVQYHPEFKSRPNRAHPVFREFISASLKTVR